MLNIFAISVRACHSFNQNNQKRIQNDFGIWLVYLFVLNKQIEESYVMETLK